MYKVRSEQISSTDAGIGKSWRFVIPNGNSGEKTIVSPLLDTIEAAQERAMSEFLKYGYAQDSISFSTYRTDIGINMIINVYGLPYLVKSVKTKIDATSIKSDITAVRYV